MYNGIMFEAARERHNALLREATEHAAQRLVPAAGSRKPGTRQRILMWLGRHLVAWGWFLRQRYGADSETYSLQSARFTQ